MTTRASPLCIAALLLLALAACEEREEARPAPAGTVSADLPPAPRIEEPQEAPDGSGPAALLRGLFEARRRGDLAFLARCGSACAEQPHLDKRDELRAWRDYRLPAVESLWRRLERAFDEGRYRLEEDGDRATARFALGGALGTYALTLVRIGGAWYVRSRTD